MPSLDQLAELVGGKPIGQSDLIISGVSELQNGKQGTISFLANPKYKKYISSIKNGIHIIDLIQTEKCIKRAAKEICNIVNNDGIILFVGTKKQAKNVVQEGADACGMYYIVERWKERSCFFIPSYVVVWFYHSYIK